MNAAERNARIALMERSQGRCELCGGIAVDACHRKARSQGGTWDLSNLLAGCRSCHTYQHSHPAEAYRKGWAVPSYENPATYPVHCRYGWVRLDDEGGWTNEPRSAA